MSEELAPDPAVVVTAAMQHTWWRRARRAVMFALSMALVAFAWEMYKKWGPNKGGSILGWKVLPRTNQMPHVSAILAQFGHKVNRVSSETVFEAVLKGSWYSLRLALFGFLIGVLIGVALAVLMTRSGIAERAVLPYLVASQTVPLIALAPLVAGWSGKVHVFGWEWPNWMSVVTLGAFLSFFPVSVGALRGLKSPPAAALELMDSLAAPWRTTLFRLRFPAAVPYLVPALKLGAAGSVIGVVVAEISTGLRGGIGRLVIEYSRAYGTTPQLVYTAVIGAAAVGLVMAGLVAMADAWMMRNRPREVES